MNLAAWAVGAALAAAVSRMAVTRWWWPALALVGLASTFLSAGMSGRSIAGWTRSHSPERRRTASSPCGRGGMGYRAPARNPDSARGKKRRRQSPIAGGSIVAMATSNASRVARLDYRSFRRRSIIASSPRSARAGARGGRYYQARITRPRGIGDPCTRGHGVRGACRRALIGGVCAHGLSGAQCARTDVWSVPCSARRYGRRSHPRRMARLRRADAFYSDVSAALTAAPAAATASRAFGMSPRRLKKPWIMPG